MPLLHQLAETPSIKLITPGRIAQARSNANSLQLRVTIPVPGGYKLLARTGRTVQEVFIRTSTTQEELQKVLDDICPPLQRPVRHRRRHSRFARVSRPKH